MKDTKHSKVLKVLELSSPFCMVKLQSREFSVNRELLVENLQKKTLGASRFAYSSVKSDANHFSELCFTPRLKQNVQAAGMRNSCIEKSKGNFMLKVIKLKRGKL